MDRRRFVVTIGGALVCPGALHAQPMKSGPPRRVGFLVLDFEDTKTPIPQRAGSLALKARGWIEGENLIVERAYADLDVERLAGLADGLVRKGVDVIVAIGPEAALAAARATRSIPIVFFGVVWPVEQGLIDSFARPGRNVTGIAFYTGVEVSNKRLEVLREIAPGAKRLSWLWPPQLAETVGGDRYDVAPVLEAAGTRLGFETRLHPVRKMADVETALADVLAVRAQAISVAGSAHLLAARLRLAEFALRHRLPTASSTVFIVEAGGLLSYAPAWAEWQTLTSRNYDYVDRILRGAKPADLPVERPSKYELVINLKTAKALGLTIPQSVLLRADRVIE